MISHQDYFLLGQERTLVKEATAEQNEVKGSLNVLSVFAFQSRKSKIVFEVISRNFVNRSFQAM